MMRTDEHNNPTAFTVDIAHQAGLTYGGEYTQGEPFHVNGNLYYTAKLNGDPVEITRKVITVVSFYTLYGSQRWSYIAMPLFIWRSLSADQQRDVIGFMYSREGGTDMRPLFPNFGKG